jgi:hypothetical protein
MNTKALLGRQICLSATKGSDKSFELNSNKQKLLRSVHFEEGFHFFEARRKYTGITSTSLSEFEEKLKIVNAQTVEYHFRRQDFQKWISDTIGDVELATQIAHLDTKLSPEKLRKTLLKKVRKRMRELEKLHDSTV